MHQARHARDRVRDPGAALPRAGHPGQGGHPHRRVPRPRQLMDPEKQHHRTTSRTKARRRAVDVLFEADQRGRYSPLELSDLLQERLSLTAAQTALPQYSADIVDGVATHLDAIDEVLTTYSQGWACLLYTSDAADE